MARPGTYIRSNMQIYTFEHTRIYAVEQHGLELTNVHNILIARLIVINQPGPKSRTNVYSNDDTNATICRAKIP